MNLIQQTRLVIETQTPMAINSGLREVGFDSQLARDANGLPYIPGTSIAGVWRNLAERLLDKSVADLWFGSTERRSTLAISDGVLLDSKQNLVKGLVSKADINADELLKVLVLARPHHRDRVALNDRGVASETAKFDQILLPKGLRFCIDVRWQGEESQLTDWQALIALWQTKLFALGADTRNGLGQIKIIGCAEQSTDLTDVSTVHPANKIRDFYTQPLPSSHNLNEVDVAPICAMTLQAESYWRFGSGTQLLNAQQTDADIISYSEPSVIWRNGQADWQGNKPVLCGSAIKGIIAHRVAFHYNQLTERFAETIADENHDLWQSRPEALSQLFGQNEVIDKTNGNVITEAVAGRLIVEDSPVEFNQEDISVRYHNSIDRFTGGVRQGALYSEELIYQPKLQVNVWLLPGKAIDPQVIQALELALDDIAYGYVPLGAGAGRSTSLMNPEPINYNKSQLSRLSQEVGL